MDIKRQNLYSTARLINAISKNTGYAEEAIAQIFKETFRVINDKIMDGKTVQVEDFGSFRLKHLGRRVKIYYPGFPELNSVSEEHLKITFMAYADVRRRADRKLQKQKSQNEDTKSE